MEGFIVTYYDAIQDQKMWVEIFAETKDKAADQFESLYGTAMPIVRIR